jgi:hypothetical protein
MAYDEHLAERIRKVLTEKHILSEERKMMGGLCFMIKEKMCMGVVDDKLMARVDPELYDQLLNKNECHQMDFTGRPMKGFVFVDPIGTDMDTDLDYWVQLCLDYNPKAKSSKKK